MSAFKRECHFFTFFLNILHFRQPAKEIRAYLAFFQVVLVASLQYCCHSCASACLSFFKILVYKMKSLEDKRSPLLSYIEVLLA